MRGNGRESERSWVSKMYICASQGKRYVMYICTYATCMFNFVPYSFGKSTYFLFKTTNNVNYEAGIRRIDQGLDIEDSSPKNGTQCDDVSVSGALTTTNLDRAN